MKQYEKGFTLIELVAVIVILGILAATAIPKFVDLQEEAYNATNKGVAGGIASAGAMNYGAVLSTINETDTNNQKGEKINRCTGSGTNSLAAQIDNLMLEDTSSWTIAVVDGSTHDLGEGFECSVVVDGLGDPAVFTFISTVP